MRFGRLDVRAGRQIIAWGRADGVNPTDNLSGQDLTLLVPDDADRRLGTTAVRASYYLGDVSLTGVWLPEFRGHEFALPAPPPGVTFVRDATRLARRSVGRARGADRARGGLVRLLFPRQGPVAGSRRRRAAWTGASGILLSHHRVRVFGADMAANVGRFGLRAEGAYVETEDSQRRRSVHQEPVRVRRGWGRSDVWRAC